MRIEHKITSSIRNILYSQFSYLFSRKRSIEVFVGTHELLRYTNASNMKEPLYLMYDSKNAIPVPLEYWKVMYDPVSHEAIAFLGNNNPHSKDIQSYKCKNICKSLKWNVLDDLLDDFEDETEGHVTCCAVKELQKHIPYLENLEGADGRKIIDASIMTNYEVNLTPIRHPPCHLMS